MMNNARYPQLAPIEESALFPMANNSGCHYQSAPQQYGLPMTPDSAFFSSSPLMFSAGLDASSMMHDHFSPIACDDQQFMGPGPIRRASTTEMLMMQQQPMLANDLRRGSVSELAMVDTTHDGLLSSSPKMMSEVEQQQPIITRKPTPRALKARRCPTNRCPCGGKEDCTEPGCIRAAGHFVCPVCSIEFSRKNSMRRHVLTHINLRPYECHACNKSFYRSDIYKRHLSSKKCRRNISQPDPELSMYPSAPVPATMGSPSVYLNHNIPTPSQ